MTDRRYIRIGFDLSKELIGDGVPTEIEFVDYLIEEAKLHHRVVGDDEDLSDLFAGTKILDRIPFEIDLLRNLEPLHGISPFADFLDVEKVDGTDVAADRVVAIGAAAESQRRQEGIVDVADAAEGRRRIPNDAQGFDLIAEGVGHRLLLAMDGGRVA